MSDEADWLQIRYELLERGPALFSDNGRACWWCGGPIHRGAVPGSACPLRRVPLGEMLPPGSPAWLVLERML